MSDQQSRIEHAFSLACERLRSSSLDQLVENDKIVLAIYMLEAEVNNGGFDQYYFNSAGDLACFAPQALTRIGARRTAHIVIDANHVFAPDGPSPDRYVRQDQMVQIESQQPDAWASFDALFYQYPDDIADLLTAFLQQEDDG